MKYFDAIIWSSPICTKSVCGVFQDSEPKWNWAGPQFLYCLITEPSKNDWALQIPKYMSFIGLVMDKEEIKQWGMKQNFVIWGMKLVLWWKKIRKLNEL